MPSLRSVRSVRGLRSVVAVSFVIAAAAGIVSVMLARRLATGNEVLIALGQARTDSAALYAQGLQMCQATRNIMLDPANQTAYGNHDAAVRDFESRLQSLQRDAARLFSGSDAVRSL